MGRSMNNCLALGTAQFGLPYGIANQVGRISRDEATTILDHAWAAGLDTIDTAIAYGESEHRFVGTRDYWCWRLKRSSGLADPCRT